jgi:flagellar motor switch protein FliM
MEQVLSQNEVNALLEAVQEGNLEIDRLEHRSNDDFQYYDLASQDKIIRGRMAGLEIIHDRLNRYLQIAMSSTLRKMVDVQLEFSGLMKFGEFINQLVSPTVLNLYKAPPLRGVAIVALETRFLFSMVNTFFGGLSEDDRDMQTLETRDLTLIERNILRKVVRTILGEIQKAWQPVYEINPQYLRSETNPQFVNVPNTDVVINTQFTIEMENAVGVLNIIIPYSMIEPIKQKLSISTQSDEMELDLHWIQRLKEEMLKAQVNIQVELGHASLTINDLDQLKTGDVIMLDTDSSSSLVINIENVPKMKGKPIIHKGHVALRVTDTSLEDEPQAEL